MNIQTERAKEISAYIEAHHDAKLRELPIVVAGQRCMYPVYKLPLELLRYNLGNGRFAVEKLILEKDLGRELNYDDSDDVAQIRKLLLEENPQPSAKSMSLIADLEHVGQMEPGVITYDGFVINGNRRMAAFEYLHSKQPSGKWKYLEVQRLPRDIDGQDLWRIEAGLQLSKEKKEAYGPMNELLKIKEGCDAGLSHDEVAAAMFEWTAKEVEEALERLRLIDAFLDFTGETSQGGYAFIEKYGLHEFFIDLQANVYRPAKSKGLPKAMLSRRLNNAYGLIWAAAMLMKSPGAKKGDRITHWHVRDLRKIYEDLDATELLERNLSQVDNPKKLKPEAVRDDLKDAQALLELKKDSQQPLRLIETATRALKNIDHKSPHFRDEDVRRAFKELSHVVKGLAKDLRL